MGITVIYNAIGGKQSKMEHTEARERWSEIERMEVGTGMGAG